MTKFEKVKKALEDLTYETSDYITITQNVDARHTGKYAIKNLVTNSVGSVSYKTLDEIINKFELKI